MSFKREGNDNNLLGVLRRRRVRELLSEDIPKDEAKLLSNGRFACLVCNHRPVFDTVDMLAHHRQGKKHQTAGEWHEHRKQELNELIKQRQMEQYIKTGNASILVSSSHSGSKLVTGAEYDPRVKKHKHKPYDRRLKLCLNNDSANPGSLLPTEQYEPQLNMNQNSKATKSCNTSKHSNPVIACPSNTAATVPGENITCSTQSNSRTLSSKCLFERILSSNEPVMHTSNLKQLVASSKAKSQPYRPVRPYVSNKHILITQDDDCDIDPSKTSDSRVSGCNNWDTLLADMKPVDRALVAAIPDVYLRLPPPAPPPPQPLPQLPPSPPPPSSTATHTEASDFETESRKARADRYLQLTQAGWKWDYKADKWIKDEDVEFDSDEEPPDPS